MRVLCTLTSWFDLYFSSTAGITHVWWWIYVCFLQRLRLLPPVSWFFMDLSPSRLFSSTWTALLSSSPFASTSAARFWSRSTIASVKASGSVSFVTHYSGSSSLTFHHTARILHHCRRSMNLHTNTPSASRSLWNTNRLWLNLVYLTNARRLQINPLECSTCLSCVLLL